MSVEDLEVGDTGTDLVEKFNSVRDISVSGNAKGKPPTEAFFVVKTGQSNVISYSTPTEMEMPPANPNIYDWRESTPGNGDFEWRVADLVSSFNFDAQNWTNGYGLQGSNIGDLGFVFADLLQKATGRSVYMVNHIATGNAISSWQSGGLAEQSLSVQVPNALAAIPQDVRPEVADYLLWAQGQSDLLNGDDPYEYVAAFGPSSVSTTGGISVLESMTNAGYFDKNKTYTVLSNFHFGYSYWSGISDVNDYMGSRSSLIYLDDFEYNKDFYWDSIALHMLGDGAVKMGQRMFAAAVGNVPEIGFDGRHFRSFDTLTGASGDNTLLHAFIVPFIVDQNETTYPFLQSNIRVSGKVRVNAFNAGYAIQYGAELAFDYSVDFDTETGTLNYTRNKLIWEDGTESPPDSAGVSIAVSDTGIFGNKFMWFTINLPDDQGDWTVDWSFEADVFGA